ncbi:MAG: hypothetical protein Q4P34_00550 [Tissierellia bacterium]|nr:hypothetical protein [Tissierellia bacterium]
MDGVLDLIKLLIENFQSGAFLFKLSGVKLQKYIDFWSEHDIIIFKEEI